MADKANRGPRTVNIEATAEEIDHHIVRTALTQTDTGIATLTVAMKHLRIKDPELALELSEEIEKLQEIRRRIKEQNVQS